MRFDFRDDTQPAKSNEKRESTLPAKIGKKSRHGKRNPRGDDDFDPNEGLHFVAQCKGRIEEAELEPPTRRFNVKALVILASMVVVTPALYFAVAAVQYDRLRRVALEQASLSSEEGHVDQALLGLDQYLETWPDDVPGLELMAKLRTESARALDEVLLAADAQDRLLRVDPTGPDRQANRRRLIELYVRWTDAIRQVSMTRSATFDKTQSRARAAVKIAEQMVAFGADDAESHRLMAMALESLANAGDSTALARSTVEYEKALRRDPGDVGSARRLAWIVTDRGDVSGADEILAELLEASPKSVEVRLLRYRHLAKTNRFDQAKAELDAATKLAPTDPEVRMVSAIESLQRRDPASARRHLAAISGSAAQVRRVAMLLGSVELAEKHPDFAVDVWRKGLLDAGGSDRELTWRLAYTLIQLDRRAEAEPLVAQYRRLSGDDDAMYHFLKGIQAEALGRPSAAIAELDKLAPSLDKAWHPELGLTLGRAFEKINDDVRAEAEYRMALKASSRSLAAWRSLARVLKKSDREKAARELEDGLAQLPEDPALWLDLALLRLEQQLALPAADRDWSKVGWTIDRAGRPSPPDPDLIKVRAEFLMAVGKPDEALGLLERAVAGDDRERDDLWMSWANGLAGQGRADEALKILERASAADRAGDHASLRIARAGLLLQGGQGRAARELLTRGVDTLPLADRVALARSRVGVLQTLGDKEGAREACLDWSRLAPFEPQAGLALLDLSQQNGDEDAAKLGLEVLRKVGGEDEPYALAGRALDLLNSSRAMSDTRTARLEKAAELSHKLMTVAPKLPVSRLVRGIVMERNHRIEEAIVDYQVALEGNTASMALARLTQLYTRLKRFDELADLKKKVKSSVSLDRVAARLAIEQGDKVGAERLVARITDGDPEDLRAVVDRARLFRELGKPEAAEEVLRVGVERARDRAEAWVALVMAQASRGASADVASTIGRAEAEYHGDRPDLLLAKLRWVAGDRDAAAKLYDEAIARHRDDLATFQAACAFAEATGRPDRAQALARQALKVPSCSAWAARTLALLLSKRPGPAAWDEAWSLVAPGGPGAGQGPADRLLRANLLASSPDPARRPEGMAELAALAEDVSPSNPIGAKTRVDLAAYLFQAGKPTDAARYIAPATDESIAAEPGPLALAVEILARAGRADEADQRLSRLAAVLPDSVQVFGGRAWVFLAQGKADEAVATLEDAAAAAEKAPDAVARHLAFINQLVVMKQPDAAERLARKVARIWPKDSCILAEWLASQGRWGESLDACRVAAAAGATQEPMRVTLNLVTTGRVDASRAAKVKAVADLVVASQPGDVGLLLMAVSLANRQKRYDDALIHCRKAFEVSPTNPLCVNGLNDMAWIFSEELDRPAEALAEVERVLKVATTTSAMDTRGVILTRLGRLDEATDQLERCLQKEPVGHRFLHLARAYQKAGQLEKYQGAIDRAKQVGINVAALGPKEREEFAAVLPH